MPTQSGIQSSAKAKKLWRKLFDWKEGNLCRVQYKTKTRRGIILEIREIVHLKAGRYYGLVRSALVEYINSSASPQRQWIRLEDLMEDDEEK